MSLLRALILFALADGTTRIVLTDRRPLWAGITPLLAFLFAIILTHSNAALQSALRLTAA